MNRAVSAALLLVVIVGFTDAASTVESRIRDDNDLSQFYQLLEASRVANNTLMYRQVTVFAPTNKAFQNYFGNTDDLVLYHMSNLALTTDEFSTSILSELTGSPPLWVTRKTGSYRPEIYINNAKVLIERSNYQSSIPGNSGGSEEKQVLHIINEVLEPVRSNPTAQPIYNPDALQFLNQSENLNLGQHRIRYFRQRVHLMHKEEVFKAAGQYTFFIPVDEGFKPATRSGKIDQKVIDGHVISGHALFTAPTPNDKDYKTLAFTDNIKVTVSFLTENDGKDTRTYIKSNTLVGDNTHATGVVLAEIVKANIPVKNGVVHLIQRPLMVVDTTVTQFLQSFKDKEDGPVYKFYEAIMDVGTDFLNDITRQRQVTLFAPSNAAWEDSSLQHIRQDKKRMLEILKLHYVREQLPLEKILKNNKNLQIASIGRKPWEIFQVATAAERKSLYFNVVQGPSGNETITVEGGGVNATVITPNIAATNGIIHIIDRVLGVPYTTIQEKLRTDPMLNSTYFLGQRRGFNNQLNDTRKRFTYFVPRDFAWKAAEIKFPSTYKKLFMPEYSYHAEQILQRHLVVADQAYTMAKLKDMYFNDTVILPTMRDTLKLHVKEVGESYHVQWQNEWIHVFRPDVECTNGIIHVIDGVFLKDSDVQVNGSASLATLGPHLIMILIAKWLL
ncbi:fasciclin-1 isoform X2 [Neodiprion lecontei]|uniref:Fasciclin-1 isoform X2 n=1 Tax=Neodiprion lecontei TaxID=441921 RepID=A0ABM3FN68_NEOLC|nr:fasciclin-1 isoform X2 [Neodiprion pinetum]XP_046589461.1 fasciclin-1 isoform X2 [Neodiprion lecontei]